MVCQGVTQLATGHRPPQNAFFVEVQWLESLGPYMLDRTKHRGETNIDHLFLELKWICIGLRKKKSKAFEASMKIQNQQDPREEGLYIPSQKTGEKWPMAYTPSRVNNSGGGGGNGRSLVYSLN